MSLSKSGRSQRVTFMFSPFESLTHGFSSKGSDLIKQRCYRHNSCHQRPAWSPWCSYTCRTPICSHTCEHIGGLGSACIHLCLKHTDVVYILCCGISSCLHAWNLLRFDIWASAAAHLHIAEWCCWRCSQTHTHSGTSPLCWHNRDLRRPYQGPYIRQCLGIKTIREYHAIHCTPGRPALFAVLVSRSYQRSVCLLHWGDNLVRSWPSSSGRRTIQQCWCRLALCGMDPSG